MRSLCPGTYYGEDREYSVSRIPTGVSRSSFTSSRDLRTISVCADCLTISVSFLCLFFLNFPRAVSLCLSNQQCRLAVECAGMIPGESTAGVLTVHVLLFGMTSATSILFTCTAFVWLLIGPKLASFRFLFVINFLVVSHRGSVFWNTWTAVCDLT